VLLPNVQKCSALQQPVSLIVNALIAPSAKKETATTSELAVG
jgi:hypothetical protein